MLSEEELCSNEPRRPLGLFYAKAQQLRKLNYTPVIVSVLPSHNLAVHSSSVQIYPNDSLHEASDAFEWIVQRAHATTLLLDEN